MSYANPQPASQKGSAHRRVSDLRTTMAVYNLDAFFIRDLSNLKWITAFEGVFDTEAAHSMIVFYDDVVLHTDSRYAHSFEEAAKGTPLIINSEVQNHAQFLAASIDRYGRNKGIPVRIGIETSVSLSEYRSYERELSEIAQNTEMIETKDVVIRLRAVKDDQEREALIAAQNVTDAAFSHIAEYIRPGMTELQVRIELEDYMRRSGADSLAFGSIVATGANAANPHAVAGMRMIERGHAVVMDFGAAVNGYCSDMTRTVFIGKPKEELARAYQAIRQANEEVEAMLKPGVTGVQAQERADAVLKDAGFEGKMGHSLGHGVGIDVHEFPVLATRNKEPLAAGNVVTVEPGVYIPGEFGMRLEDFGIITRDGFEVFTQSSHDMVII